MNHENILYREESYKIQGAIFDVYKEMGSGFLEAVYQECLEAELKIRQIPFVPQCELQLFYKGISLAQKYKPDLICYDKIIVEIKAVKELAPEHQAQVLNYLNVTGFDLALLVNFGCYPKVQIQRYANTMRRL